MERTCEICGCGLAKKPGPGRWRKACDACHSTRISNRESSRRKSAWSCSPPRLCIDCGVGIFVHGARGPKPKRCDACRRNKDKARGNERRSTGADRIHKRVCAMCCAEYSTSRRTQKYCSADCARLATRDRKIVQCCSCGKDIESVGKRGRKFCSRQCCWRFAESRRPACDFCGKRFKKRPCQTEWQGKNKYCSRSCFHDHRWGTGRPRLAHDSSRTSKRALGLGLRARCKKFGVPFDPACTREAVCERDGWKCQACGIKCHTGQCRFDSRTRKGSPRNAHHDHIVPLSRRDPSKGNTFDNSQCLCARCNGRKAAKGGGQMLLPFREAPRREGACHLGIGS